MTSELRPAVEVWWKATDAWKEGLSPEDGTEAAAAIIEQDREAVRAEQAAEIGRLNALADEQARYANVKKDEVRGLTAKLAKFKALAETLAGALEEAAYSVGMSSYDRHKVADKVLLQYKEARDER